LASSDETFSQLFPNQSSWETASPQTCGRTSSDIILVVRNCILNIYEPCNSVKSPAFVPSTITWRACSVIVLIPPTELPIQWICSLGWGQINLIFNKSQVPPLLVQELQFGTLILLHHLSLQKRKLRT
jgi:hypothetical protein